jgi:DNA-binding LacI/PurR family transcriptional regulator
VLYIIYPMPSPLLLPTPGYVDPDAEEKKRREAEEAARAAARAHGTPVTVEAFLAWKATYDAGQSAAAAAIARSNPAPSAAQLCLNCADMLHYD